jgi:hypothetical protein
VTISTRGEDFWVRRAVLVTFLDGAEAVARGSSLPTARLGFRVSRSGSLWLVMIDGQRSAAFPAGSARQLELGWSRNCRGDGIT